MKNFGAFLSKRTADRVDEKPAPTDQTRGIPDDFALGLLQRLQRALIKSKEKLGPPSNGSKPTARRIDEHAIEAFKGQSARPDREIERMNFGFRQVESLKILPQRVESRFVKIRGNEPRLTSHRLAKNRGLSAAPRTRVKDAFARTRPDRLGDELTALLLDDEIARIEAGEAPGIS